MIGELRSFVRLGIDDITEVTRRGIAPDLSRSVVFRCLRRIGLGGRLAPLTAPQAAQVFVVEAFGYVHIDLKYLGKLHGRGDFAFVAIERISRFVHVEILPDRSKATVAAALERFLAVAGFTVHTILTDRAVGSAIGSSPMARGSEFTDRFARGSKAGNAARFRWWVAQLIHITISGCSAPMRQKSDPARADRRQTMASVSHRLWPFSTSTGARRLGFRARNASV